MAVIPLYKELLDKYEQAEDKEKISLEILAAANSEYPSDALGSFLSGGSISDSTNTLLDYYPPLKGQILKNAGLANAMLDAGEVAAKGYGKLLKGGFNLAKARAWNSPLLLAAGAVPYLTKGDGVKSALGNLPMVPQLKGGINTFNQSLQESRVSKDLFTPVSSALPTSQLKVAAVEDNTPDTDRDSAIKGIINNVLVPGVVGAAAGAGGYAGVRYGANLFRQLDDTKPKATQAFLKGVGHAAGELGKGVSNSLEKSRPGAGLLYKIMTGAVKNSPDFGPKAPRNWDWLWGKAPIGKQLKGMGGLALLMSAAAIGEGIATEKAQHRINEYITNRETNKAPYVEKEASSDDKGWKKYIKPTLIGAGIGAVGVGTIAGIPIANKLSTDAFELEKVKSEFAAHPTYTPLIEAARDSIKEYSKIIEELKKSRSEDIATIADFKDPLKNTNLTDTNRQEFINSYTGYVNSRNENINSYKDMIKRNEERIPEFERDNKTRLAKEISDQKEHQHAVNALIFPGLRNTAITAGAVGAAVGGAAGAGITKLKDNKFKKEAALSRPVKRMLGETLLPTLERGTALVGTMGVGSYVLGRDVYTGQKINDDSDPIKQVIIDLPMSTALSKNAEADDEYYERLQAEHEEAQSVPGKMESFVRKVINHPKTPKAVKKVNQFFVNTGNKKFEYAGEKDLAHELVQEMPREVVRSVAYIAPTLALSLILNRNARKGFQKLDANNGLPGPAPGSTRITIQEHPKTAALQHILGLDKIAEGMGDLAPLLGLSDDAAMLIMRRMQQPKPQEQLPTNQNTLKPGEVSTQFNINPQLGKQAMQATQVMQGGTTNANVNANMNANISPKFSDKRAESNTQLVNVDKIHSVKAGKKHEEEKLAETNYHGMVMDQANPSVPVSQPQQKVPPIDYEDVVNFAKAVNLQTNQPMGPAVQPAPIVDKPYVPTGTASNNLLGKTSHLAEIIGLDKKSILTGVKPKKPDGPYLPNSTDSQALLT